MVFTSGGTEADNLAVKGLFWSRRAADPLRRRVLTAAIEHHAVLDCLGWLHDHEGAEAGWRRRWTPQGPSARRHCVKPLNVTPTR